MDLAERLSALEGEGLTDRTLRTAQLDLIATRFGFDAHVFAMTDPQHGHRHLTPRNRSDGRPE